MEKPIGKSWAQIKEKIAVGLKLQWDDSRWGDSYYIFVVDESIIYDTRIFLNTDDATDFETNYKDGGNELLSSTSKDGVPQVNSIPAVSTSESCFCPPASGSVTPANPNVDYTIADSYVQLFGMELEVVGAEVGDSIQFEVGVIVGGNWILLANYGGKHFIGPNWNFSFMSPVLSNPIPQGAILRLSWTFGNPETTNSPKVSAMYHLWRPNA